MYGVVSLRPRRPCPTLRNPRPSPAVPLRDKIGGMATFDTIIIGAGLSGLAAGIRLAYYEQRVCILERHYTIGGLNSFYRLRGRDYDVGLHAVTNFAPKGAKKGPLARLLRQLRLSLGRFFARAAGRLGDRLSRRAAGVQQRHPPAGKRDRPRLSAAARQFSAAARPDSRLRRPEPGRVRALGPADSRRARSPIRCWSRCCSAR